MDEALVFLLAGAAFFISVKVKRVGAVLKLLERFPLQKLLLPSLANRVNLMSLMIRKPFLQQYALHSLMQKSLMLALASSAMFSAHPCLSIHYMAQ
ncbi:TPA: hypothetical protein HA361_00130 [Candidatus Woesearchaeota archaeon]|nr:hypothetical protein [Candidatus Woesearchaeota archaeon]HII69044.1 hypothetical protein [Candidatus Woesearchaeota archaeon]